MGWVSGNYSTSSQQDANIQDGYYRIESAVDFNFVLDVYGSYMDNGANVQIYRNHGGKNQIFLIRRQSDGYYTITAVHSGKSLDVAGNGQASGTNIMQYESHGGDNQKWKIIRTSDGRCSFISKCNGLYLDLQDGRVVGGVNIRCWSGNGSNAQKFRLQSTTVDGKTYQPSNNGGNNQTNKGFQMPLSNARCSWRSSSNWSWGENRNGGGYSSGRVYHLGVDLLGSSDSVYATASGNVVRSGWNNANGNYIVIQHNISGSTVYSFYAHLKTRSVAAGTKVEKGQQIGIVGNTGSSSAGKHLHFAMMNTLWNGSYYGYSTYFTGNAVNYQGVTYYNPVYIIQNGRLP